MSVIVVLGAPRGGTALVGRMLSALGVEVARPAEIARINDGIIRAFGGSSTTPPALPSGWERSERALPFRAAAEAALALGADAERFAIVDPRLAWTLALWRDLRPPDHEVVSIRSPRAVAAGLSAKDGLELEAGAMLWLDQIAAAWSATSDRVIVEHERLVEDPTAALAALSGALSLGASEESLATAAGMIEPTRTRYAGPPPSGAGLAVSDAVHELIRADDPAVGPLLARLAEAAREPGRPLPAPATTPRAPQNGESEQLHELVRDARTRYVQLRSRRMVRIALRVAERLGGDPGPPVDPWGILKQPLAPIVPARLRRAWGRVAGRIRALLRSGAGRVRELSAAGGARPHEPASAAEAASLQAAIEAAVGPAEDSGPSVSIVILNRDGGALLRELLPSLERTRYGDFDVVLFDNASSDDSCAYAEEWAAAAGVPATVIRSPENLTFAEANNRALADARGELVLFLNNDIAAASPDWLGHMVEALSEDVGAIGARLIHPRREDLGKSSDTIYPDLSLQHRGVHFVTGPDGMPLARNLGTGEDPLGPAASESKDVVAVTAACLLARRTDLEELGGFDETYRWGTEDVDLCLRLRRLRGRNRYAAGAVLYHRDHATQDTFSSRAKRDFRLHNRREFIDRWGAGLHRELLLDRIGARGLYSEQPLQVGVMVTSTAADSMAGDRFTGGELRSALAAAGFEARCFGREQGEWSELPADLDVVVSMLPSFPHEAVPEGAVSVAWVRNWTDRWLEQESFEDFDVVLTSSFRQKRIIEARAPQVAEPFALCTDGERFGSAVADPRFACDVLYVGSYWNAHRPFADAIAHIPSDVDLRIYGRGWGEVPEARPFYRGPLDYADLPAAYASAKLVIDDAGFHVAPYAAMTSRVYDALAAGALVATTNADAVDEVFGPGAMPIWNDGPELVALIEEVLGSPDAARERWGVERLRASVLAHHTYAERAQQLVGVLRRWAESNRFTILVGCPRAEEKENWGDYHYAVSLRRQLERRGHPARVALLPDWEGARVAQSHSRLHLRGLSDLRTRSGQREILWVISHPDLVDASFADRYDAAFIASPKFADRLRAEARVPVAPLLQAADCDRFRPDLPGEPTDLLFIANSRGVKREIVDYLLDRNGSGPRGGAVALGRHRLTIYGTGWPADVVAAGVVRGSVIPNAVLGEWYANAAIVLNDHWPDMKREGLISNRIFDALACGTCVLSDDVEGLDELFEGAVAVYRDRDDLHATIERLMADPAERAERGRRGMEIVRARHSFEQRTDELLAKLDELRPAG